MCDHFSNLMHGNNWNQFVSFWREIHHSPSLSRNATVSFVLYVTFSQTCDFFSSDTSGSSGIGAHLSGKYTSRVNIDTIDGICFFPWNFSFCGTYDWYSMATRRFTEVIRLSRSCLRPWTSSSSHSACMNQEPTSGLRHEKKPESNARFTHRLDSGLLSACST